MGQLKIRETSADLPDLPEEAQLTQVDMLAGRGKLVSRFELVKTVVRAFGIEDTQLLDGQVRSLRADSSRVKGLTVRSLEFTQCDIRALRWSGGVISRTRFDGCKLLAARFENVTMDHVVFSDCRLDYAALSQIRARGPVLFAGCSLREVEFRGCDLAHTLFDQCDLTLTDFGPAATEGVACAVTTWPRYAERITSSALSLTVPKCSSARRRWLRTSKSASAMNARTAAKQAIQTPEAARRRHCRAKPGSRHHPGPLFLLRDLWAHSRW